MIDLWWGVAGSLIFEAEMVLQMLCGRADLELSRSPGDIQGLSTYNEQHELTVATINPFSSDSKQLTGSLRDEGSSTVRVLSIRYEKEIQMARGFKSIVNTYS